MSIYQFEVRLKDGLQARNICGLINLIHSFDLSVKIIKENKIHPLDPIELMSMSIKTGQKISLLILGLDKEKAIKEIEVYLMGP